MFNLKRVQKVMKDRVTRDIRKNKAKGSTKHRAVSRNRRVGEVKRAAKIKEEISNFQNHRTRNGMTITATPTPISNPFCLIVQACRRAAAKGKLVSHS